MVRRAFVLFAAFLLAAGAADSVRAQSVDGNWKFSLVVNGNVEQTLAIVAVKTEGGKTTGELVAGTGRFAKASVKSVKVDGKLLHLVLDGGGLDLAFEGVPSKQAGKQILGSASFGTTVYPAMLTATEDKELDGNAVRTIDCPPLKEARTLTTKAAKLRQAALAAKDPEKKTELLKEYDEADAQIKKLYREVVQNHADTPAIFDAGIALIRSSKKYGKMFDVKALAKTIDDAAKPYGPRWHEQIVGQLASALTSQPGQAALALDYAKQMETGLSAKAPAADQVRVLGIVSRALRNAGKTEEAAKLDARIEKMEEPLDREYHGTMPGFKGQKFEGRKSKSERVVFMELFTGAMCPPCVAADLAFDVLQKTYKPSELVLVQYHMHIPGPDPLTNKDTEARWDYYRAAFPKKVGGVPSSLFDGEPKAGGGGGVGNAESKYEAYRAVIEPSLEKETSIKLTAKAERNGDKIDINVRMSGLADPGSNKKLRILLAEETVRYLGGNKIRFHHNVVRAFPGGVEGKSLTEPAAKHSVSISLGELRGKLTDYLDDFEASGRTFANPSRPMALSHLRVIAFVQDDDSHEILQAVQVEVEGK